MWQNMKACHCPFYVWLLGLLLCFYLYLRDASLSSWCVPSDYYTWVYPFLYMPRSGFKKKHGIAVRHPSLINCW